jgi:beta-N-acetylhexosaminidase
MLENVVGMTDAKRKLAGRVLTTGVPGPQLDRDTLSALRHMQPSGVILFRRNIEDPGQLRELTRALHSLPSCPWISLDHEGGRVLRVGEPFTLFPCAREVACSGDLSVVEAVGRAMGLELRSVGIDINFAPVLDVDSNPANPIIGDRAFANNPAEVARCAFAFQRGLLSGGVLPCGKHFPGHGDTNLDSHTDLPVVHRSRAQLEEVELPPFRAAIAAGAPLLMTAHVVYSALDPHQPATLSRSIVYDLLRKELGYAGVVVSDDLEMRAIRARLPVPDAAVAALRAGVDWLLVCTDFEQSIATSDRITAALAVGEIEERTLLSAARRIGQLPRPTAAQECAMPVAEHVALCEKIREGGRRRKAEDTGE